MSLLHMPPEVLSNPAFTGEIRNSLARTSKATRDKVMHASTVVRASAETAEELQTVINSLCHTCHTEGLLLRKLALISEITHLP